MVAKRSSSEAIPRQSDPDYKTLAWNRLRVDVPVDWDISRIDRRYLMLECRGAPVMEVKWSSVKRPARPATIFKQIKKNRKRYRDVREMPVPEQWEKALRGFDDVLCFCRAGGCISGQGVLLFSRSGGHVILVQFFTSLQAPAGGVDVRVLSTLKVGGDEDPVIWSVFDIHAAVPKEFRLTGYRFSAGYFRMEFSGSEKKMMLYRWGPAITLLRRVEMEYFARKALNISSNMRRRRLPPESSAVEWNNMKAENAAWRPRFFSFGHRRYRYVRIRHEKTASRLLAVELRSRRPLSREFFERIYAGYVSVPQKTI